MAGQVGGRARFACSQILLQSLEDRRRKAQKGKLTLGFLLVCVCVKPKDLPRSMYPCPRVTQARGLHAATRGTIDLCTSSPSASKKGMASKARTDLVCLPPGDLAKWADPHNTHASAPV